MPPRVCSIKEIHPIPMSRIVFIDFPPFFIHKANFTLIHVCLYNGNWVGTRCLSRTMFACLFIKIFVTVSLTSRWKWRSNGWLKFKCETRRVIIYYRVINDYWFLDYLTIKMLAFIVYCRVIIENGSCLWCNVRDFLR